MLDQLQMMVHRQMMEQVQMNAVEGHRIVVMVRERTIAVVQMIVEERMMAVEQTIAVEQTMAGGTIVVVQTMAAVQTTVPVGLWMMGQGLVQND